MKQNDKLRLSFSLSSSDVYLFNRNQWQASSSSRNQENAYSQLDHTSQLRHKSGEDIVDMTESGELINSIIRWKRNNKFQFP